MQIASPIAANAHVRSEASSEGRAEEFELSLGCRQFRQSHGDPVISAYRESVFEFFAKLDVEKALVNALGDDVLSEDFLFI